MKRRFGTLIAAATLLSTLAVLHSVQPASAAVCAGQGNATLSTGIGLPLLGGATGVGFTISAPCVNGGSMNASGTLQTAACGRSTGGGTVNGKPFDLETAGSILVITPRSGSGVVGVGNAVADPRVANNSCANGTAKNFLVTAAGQI